MDTVKDITEAISNKIVEASSFIKGMSIHEDEVAFLGLDERGQVLVQHLLNAGVKVRVWEPKKRRHEERKISAGEQVTIMDSLTDAIKSVHVIMCALPTYLEVEQTLTEDETLLRSMTHKTLVVFTPLSVSESEELYHIFKRFGIEYIEAALCGSFTIAEKAQLKLFVGGSEEQYTKLKSIFSLFGTSQYVGFIPKATAIKQSLNLVLAAENMALAYATAYLYKQGLNPEIFVEAMKQARGDLDDKMKAFESRTYSTSGTSNDDVLNDITNMFNDSAKNGLDGKLLDVLKTNTEKAKELSGGEKDFASIYDVLNPPTTARSAK